MLKKRAGWWKISVSLATLARLDKIRSELEEDAGGKVSYDRVVDRLISEYRA